MNVYSAPFVPSFVTGGVVHVDFPAVWPDHPKVENIYVPMFTHHHHHHQQVDVISDVQWTPIWSGLFHQADEHHRRMVEAELETREEERRQYNQWMCCVRQLKHVQPIRPELINTDMCQKLEEMTRKMCEQQQQQEVNHGKLYPPTHHHQRRKGNADTTTKT